MWLITLFEKAAMVKAHWLNADVFDWQEIEIKKIWENIEFQQADNKSKKTVLMNDVWNYIYHHIKRTKLVFSTSCITACLISSHYNTPVKPVILVALAPFDISGTYSIMKSNLLHSLNSLNRIYSIVKSRVSCQNGPTRHAYAWQIRPFGQDTQPVLW